MFQHLALICTSGYPSQAETCRVVTWTICVGLTLSCLPQTSCWTLLRVPEPPILPADLPASEGASPNAGTSSYLQLPARDAVPFLLPLLFLFPSSFFHLTQLCQDLSYLFRCLRSSASVQQVLCENCSICRYILDEFVRRDELRVLLLLRYLGLLRRKYSKSVDACFHTDTLSH